MVYYFFENVMCGLEKLENFLLKYFFGVVYLVLVRIRKVIVDII